MKVIRVKTTESRKVEVIKKYSRLVPSEDQTPVWIDVLIDDNDSGVFKRLSTDPDVKDWEFKEEQRGIQIPVGDELIKLSEVDLTPKKDLSERIDLKDMSEVIWWCTSVYIPEVIQSMSSPEEVFEYCVAQKTPVYVPSSEIWDGLSEGIIKTVLLAMGQGVKKFSEDLTKKLLRAGHYYSENRPGRQLTKEEILHTIFGTWTKNC